MHFVRRQLVAAQNEADLWSIAVGDNEFPAGFHHAGQMAAGLTHRIPLVRNIWTVFVRDKGVASNRDQSGFAHKILKPG